VTLLELARAIEPDFPSSAGRPFRMPDPELLRYARALTRLNEAAVAHGRGDDSRAHELLAAVDSVELAADDRFELEWLRRRLRG
jgi:hypothetical protein